MHRKAFVALMVVCCLTATAYAVPTITAGNWKLAPNMAGQTVDAVSALPIAVMVSGGDAIAGVDLGMTIGGGAGLPTEPNFDTIPAIVAPGNVFNAGNANAQFDFFGPGLGFTYGGTTTLAGTVAATGTLALLSIDTTGLFAGTWTLFLSENVILVAASDLPPFATPFLVAGSLTIVPEPGTMVLALFAASGLCVVAIRRRRKVA